MPDSKAWHYDCFTPDAAGKIGILPQALADYASRMPARRLDSIGPG